MRKRVLRFVYLNPGNYISYQSLKSYYWGIIIIPIIMVTFSVAAIQHEGVNGRSLFPLVSISIWSLLYWIFVFVIGNKHVKKTFELRFLVNGIAGLDMSSLFWLVFASLNLIADNPILDFDICLWMIPLYLFVSAVVVLICILGVRRDVYGKMKEIGQTKTAIAISAFFSSIIPVSGVLGMRTARQLREHASVEIQDIIGTTVFVLLIFIPVLAHINFVQYYYCKKYHIHCDENGDTTSPELEPKKKEKTKKSKENILREKKNRKLILKIILVLICIPIAIFIVFCMISFIKGFIRGIAGT